MSAAVDYWTDFSDRDVARHADNDGHVPDSIRASAQRELRRRGYLAVEVDWARLHGGQLVLELEARGR